MFRRVALATDFVAHPSARGVHRESTPLLGGAAIFLAFLVGLGVSSFFLESLPPTRLLGYLAGGALVFVMGIVDDRRDLGWFSKLLGQTIAAILLLASGNTAGPFFLSPVGLILSVVWVVGLTNAMNFLDNMDGLCAGIGSVGALSLAALALSAGEPGVAAAAVAVAGAAAGFLRFNFSPAKIFLGDGGSLFLGYSLASLGLMTCRQMDWSFSLLVPVIALAYPIFDITFVTATRQARGQSLAQGGKDHTSHRINRILHSDRGTAGAIYAMCAFVGLVAIALERLAFPPATVVTFFVVFFLFLGFGVRLARRTPLSDHPAGATIS